MSTTKKSVQSLVKICELKDIKNIVLSPGSRNAPLAIEFDNNKNFHHFQITDERVAGFFALGLAQQSRIASVICCTSGTATLNYAPAIAEAYYQRIPMIILTADRPVQWIDQGAGQSLRQQNIYDNYVLKSFQLPQSIHTKEDQWYNDRIINEAINLAHSAVPGPVHINIPLEEPLYDREANDHLPKIITPVETRRTLTNSSLKELQAIWASHDKKMIICGMLPNNDVINKKINQLAEDPSVVVLSESHSNVNGDIIFQCIDRLIESFDEGKLDDFTPDLLLSFGHSIISKKVKALLHRMSIKSHWHVDSINDPNDTFQHLTHHIKMAPVDFLTTFIPIEHHIPFDFQKTYNEREVACCEAHDLFIRDAAFSDLKAFSLILPELPFNSMLQMGNSASVRYVQLFNQRKDISYFANRGVSGIEGCTSTACGAAHHYLGITTLVTGDLSFLYDSNGLWHKYINPNLRIIIINNKGGGIFRIIKGPSDTPQLSSYFEASHDMTGEKNAEKFDLEYLTAENENELSEVLKSFYNTSEKAKILEVFTPPVINDKVLKDYFSFIYKRTKV
ncbi:2-succinyl-5-enolpyruvyl-6-hydroxy-3-cyclohexene-1-carboxylic-acid synthase [Portibacter lacus]|uniref:2-succinyl-5-enolpyruvyl-6-hydroxy-3-cyclohexene-1-carboxylate synthase n=1 Tax=Portibacter lacus TaxID=1099794 RepID=A0AA37SNS4_9BACT|nr:2-succinyl-5-enolpyruvyl-6-hydroxy-3-cyclohexene-1-carboxylic-acid synthase [Portibacter lacus]GLR18106.1 2-succinyl-5-enolpyruvyl-6-hydroxy-3-cyclohexene- 1-carboxylate synthase [Portibacter lacus]